MRNSPSEVKPDGKPDTRKAFSHKISPGCLDGGIDQPLMNEHLIRLFNSIAVDTQLFHQLALRGQLKACLLYTSYLRQLFLKLGLQPVQRFLV